MVDQLTGGVIEWRDQLNGSQLNGLNRCKFMSLLSATEFKGDLLTFLFITNCNLKVYYRMSF